MSVPTKDIEILLLESAIRQMHLCEVVHQKSVFVDQKFQGTTIWMGYVEVFELKDHPKATHCFAWLHQEEGERAKPVVILDRWPINSPEMAVGAAITFDIPHKRVGFDLTAP